MAWDVIDDIKANLDRIRYLSIKGVSEIAVIVGAHQQVFDEMKSGDDKHAVNRLMDHLYKIALTYNAIRAKKSEWFTQEN